MNLIEKLLCVDKEKATEKATKKIKSKKLAKLVGEDAEITIRELSGKRYNTLQAMLFDKKGNRDVNATCVISNNAQQEKTRTLMEYKLEELTKRVNEHNNLIKRTYALEEKISVHEEQIKVANHRIEDLERKGE